MTPIPGFRYFKCPECGHEFKDRSRDCRSPSGDDCPNCEEWVHPHASESHPEWPVDGSGNLKRI